LVGLSTPRAQDGHEKIVKLTNDGKFNLLFVTMGNAMTKFMNYADRASLIVLAIMLVGLPAATVGFLAH
jgi:hypothetical protein